MSDRSYRLLTSLCLPLALAAFGCSDDSNSGGGGPPIDNTTEVGTFDGLFDDVVTGFNYPYDIGIVSDDVVPDGVARGDILVANYGTSEILLARDKDGAGPSGAAEAFYDGGEASLRGAMAVSIPPDGMVWAAFERGGDGDGGGVAVLAQDGTRVALLDNTVEAGAFSNPGGICYGGVQGADKRAVFYLVNKGDGTVWRITAASTEGDDAIFTQLGGGLATGAVGNPGTPGNELSGKTDLPEDGARGCVYDQDSVYVADAQNARIVRFDDADEGGDVEGVALEDTPAELVTYPTDVTINSEGALIVISFDNAHAFVSLETPTGAFLDNGLHDLNVNSGNYGTQVADGVIWFTRANNSNGALRAITADTDTPPDTAGTFPAQ